MEKATKELEGKPQLFEIPLEVLLEMAKVRMANQHKYDRDNRLKPIEASLLFDATLRHMLAWYSGIDMDSETGCNHMTHALYNLAMFVSSQQRGTLIDDRLKFK